MAKKKSALGTLLKLGGIAAATAAVYYKRNEIRAFLSDALERVFPEDADTEPVEDFIPVEPEIIIDGTANAVAQKEKKTEEDTPEEA